MILWRITLFLSVSIITLVAQSFAEPVATDSVFLNQVDSLRASNHNTEALALINGALPSARDSREIRPLLLLLLRQGACLIYLNQSKASLSVLSEAVALAEAQADSVLLCDSFRFLGLAHSNQGHKVEARKLYEHLFILAKACNQLEFQGWAQIGMGWQDYRAGHAVESARRYRDAVSYFKNMGETIEPDSNRGLVMAWNGVGLSEQSLGNYSIALKAYENSVELARLSGNGIGESMAINNLGTLTFSLGDPATALEYFERAITLQLQFGNNRGAVAPAMNVALCRMGLGRYAKAEANLDSLATVCRENHYLNLEAAVLNKQADLAMNRRREQKAVSMFQEVLALSVDLPLKNRIDSYIGISQALGALDRPEEALAILDIALNVIPGSGSAYQRLLINAEKSLYLQSLGRHREALELLQMVNKTAKQRKFAGFRMRALAGAAASFRALAKPDSSLLLLLEASKVWEAQRNLTLDPQWREQRSLAGRHVFTDLAVAILDQKGEVSTESRIGLAFNELQVFKARTLLERLYGPDSAADSSLTVLEPITLADLQHNVLAKGELLLDYYVGGEVSLLFAVTQQECLVTRLPNEEEMIQKISAYNCFISRRSEQAADSNLISLTEDVSSVLKDLLLNGLDKLIADSELVFFSPDAVLNLLPPAALLPPGQGPPWSRIPSATLLARLREDSQAISVRPSNRILALVGTRSKEGQVLPGAIRETERLAQNFHGVEIQKQADGLDKFQDPFTMADLAGFDILHLATHALMNDENPWQSYINLPGFGRHGRLTAGNIAAAHLDARLAVLAACESGCGRVLSGEGVLGLTSAFISAGVPAVVATLWPVDDTATERLMGIFYDKLGNGLNVAAALHSAREALRSDPKTAHPFYWAGFIIVGDGNLHVPLERRMSLRRPVLGGLGLLALGIFISSWRRPS